MLGIFGSALILGADSMAAAAAIAPLIPQGGARLRLALVFGGCDALASYAGWALAIAPPSWLPAALPGGMALCGAYFLLLGSVAPERRRIVYLLPPLLCLDNLLAPGPLPDALLFGTVSAALAYFGLLVGAALGGSAPRRREHRVGAGVLAAAALLLVT